ncbi:AAA family ATPase [Kribbella shirazensis]|uniref:DNA-binding CsgD family transcriptional regulator/tetratricopeptide (TPR) repeat protein n=1 Tax=Kribbella shirazensis TaxID=1105143 RepID=A0A7X6A545_9ACTN|nr:DNA-binding CsgD family transcriptional regulator/tetratricopeptide (TPR) repeat protein [Kribbella shirazensis]
MAGGAEYGIRGRRAELAQLDGLVADIRTNEGRVLLIRGEPGIGKSVLLDHLAANADGCRVARASGVESEMELPFAGLHQLCAPMLDLVERLPPVQREALEVAFGLRAGAPPDRFVVGAATLTLLSEASAGQPLLCVVDDGQWLDQASAQALTFAGRRLFADRIGLVFAVRDPLTGPEWRGLAELPIGGLADHDAKALLTAAIPGRIDEHVRDRIVAETRGNPLALLELPRGLSTAELAGGFEQPDVRPLASQIEQHFHRRVQSLPPQTQRLLLTAAADSVGDLLLLRRALTHLDVPMSAAHPAEEAGLIDLGAPVRFRHPLVRSATYRSATPADRRAVHRALADATDPAVDPDRRAWHRANGALEPDEEIAEDLIASADRASRRGGLAAMAAFLRRATELTPDPAKRADRALAAAQASFHAGAFETTLKLLVTADEDSADELRRARADLVRARVAFATGHGMDAPRMLLDTADRLEPLDPALARDTYLDAITAAMFAGRFGAGAGLPVVARAARAAPSPAVRGERDLLLDTLARLFTDDYPAAVPLARDVMAAFSETDDARNAHDLRWIWLATLLAIDLWDDESWDVLTAKHVRIARGAGDLTEIPSVLGTRVILQMFAGEFTVAESVIREIETIWEATGLTPTPYQAVTLAAWRGQVERTEQLVGASLDGAEIRGEGGAVTSHQWARAVLLNSRGRYQDALAAAQVATEYPVELGVANWALPELVEAAVYSGRPDAAAEAMERLTMMAEASGTPWALGVLARARALLSTDATAKRYYREAIEYLSRTRIRMDLARAHLVYGEWLRREGPRQEAREQLRTAYELFSAAGADGFAERARHELAAAGEVVHEPTRQANSSLTAQEARIAELAGAGLTNADIGAQMFLSRHTVEWHLRKVFTKLGIRSRRQLQVLLDNHNA